MTRSALLVAVVLVAVFESAVGAAPLSEAPLFVDPSGDSNATGLVLP
jgi:hypothetical protein